MKFLAIFLITSIALAQSPVPAGAKVVTISTGLIQPEGPVWKDGKLLFSDIQGNVIYQWLPADSMRTVYLSPSVNSNGLTLDKQGRLVFTQMGQRRVSRQEVDGKITILTATFRGKRYNSPNDLVVRSDGSIYFTDTDFNVPSGQSVELNFKGVYRISPTGTVTLLDSSFNKPNGICLSPDESKLYVNESPLGKIYVWDFVNDSIIANKKLLYTIPAGGYADGMKTDPVGNVYCTGPQGVWIVSPAGGYIDKIPMSHGPSNCAWGDADGKTLYITGGYGDGTLYKIRLAPATGINDHGSLLMKTDELYANYPNPFNPNTVISYSLSARSWVTLKIYDSLGREVAILTNTEQPVGFYQIKWSASTLSSGIYYALLSTQDANSQRFTSARKMILEK